jgi:hypothetical protein
MQMFSLIWHVGNSCLFVCDRQLGFRLPLQISVKNTISLRSATLISPFLTWAVPSKLCLTPATNNSIPVIKLLSSEARNDTAFLCE